MKKKDVCLKYANRFTESCEHHLLDAVLDLSQANQLLEEGMSKDLVEIENIESKIKNLEKEINSLREGIDYKSDTMQFNKIKIDTLSNVLK